MVKSGSISISSFGSWKKWIAGLDYSASHTLFKTNFRHSQLFEISCWSKWLSWRFLVHFIFKTKIDNCLLIYFIKLVFYSNNNLLCLHLISQICFLWKRMWRFVYSIQLYFRFLILVFIVSMISSTFHNQQIVKINELKLLTFPFCKWMWCWWFQMKKDVFPVF